MSDQEMMDDVLASQKLITSDYNTCANEAANAPLRATFMNLLKDEHEIQADIFDQMSERGWYQVKQADQTMINQTKQKFMQSTNA